MKIGTTILVVVLLVFASGFLASNSLTLKTRIAELEDKLAIANDHIARLESQKSILEQELDSMKQRILELEAQLAETIEALNAATERIADLEKDKAERGAEIAKLNELIQDLKAANAEYLADIQALAGQIKTLNEEQEAARQRAEVAEMDLAGLKIACSQTISLAGLVTLPTQEKLVCNGQASLVPAMFVLAAIVVVVAIYFSNGWLLPRGKKKPQSFRPKDEILIRMSRQQAREYARWRQRQNTHR